MKKQLISGMLSVLMVVLACVPAAFAGEDRGVQREIIYCADGFYLVREVEVETQARAAGQVTGNATQTLYNSSDTALLSVTVRGTFTYDGKTAEADSATYSYHIYDTAWRFKSGSAHCDGNQAIAEVTFGRGLFVSRTIEAVLTCSPEGKLS